MISPSQIDVTTLPSVALTERSQLPESPCIYFAIDEFCAVQYIGRTVNARQRWGNHHRYNDLIKTSSPKIAYLFIDAIEQLPEIEEALIQWFAPPLNKAVSGGVLSDRLPGQRFTFTIEPDLYEPLKAQAKKERRSMGSLLNWLAAKYLEEQQGVEIEAKVQHGGDRKSDTAKGEQ